MTLKHSAQARPIADHPIVQWLALLAIGVGWGCTGPFTKTAVSTGNHPIGIAFWEALICAITLTVVLLLFRWRPPTSIRYLVFFMLCGFFGTVLPNVLSYTAYKHLPIGVNVILLSFVPMATLLIALPLRLEHADWKRIAGLALGVLAILMIYLPRTSLPEPGQAMWVALPVLVAISYAIENAIIAGCRPSDLNPVMIICALSWAALFFLAPLVAFSDAWVDLSRMGPAELAIVAIACLHMGSYMGFVWLVDRSGPVFASQVGYIVTASGVVLGMLIFNEQHSAWIWASLTTIFLGLALVRPKKRYSSN